VNLDATAVVDKPNELQLRTICRHVESLTVQHARDQKRLYAAQGSISTPRRVIQDLKHALAAGGRIHKLRLKP
jgi:hypothetical protein